MILQRRRRVLHGVAIAGLLLQGNGCYRPSGGGSQAGPTQLPARRNTYVVDIPVPTGFSIVPDKSQHKSLAAPPVRWVDHLYEGSQDPLAVRNFYLINMGEHKWQPIVETAHEGTYTMKFRKGIEVCEITVKRSGSGRFWAPVTIHVVLEPQQEGAANPSPSQ